jgi:outer membrane protein assembly factor BamB
MRLRIACFSAFLFYLTATPSLIFGQVSDVEARRMGMEIAWESQVQMPRVGSGVVSSHLWVESSDPRKYAVVELSGRTIRVAADSLDRRGRPIGMEVAKQQATEQAARYLGKNAGFEVVETISPRIKLALVTNDGLVQTLDAETGRLIWAASCGRTSAPAHPAAATQAGVLVIHGDRLYLLDWETGRQLMNTKLTYASANSVVACGRIAYVSDFTGRVETYELPVRVLDTETEVRKLGPWGYKIQGRATGPSVSLADESFCAIATNQGYLYTFTGGDHASVYTRYQTASAINGSLTASNGFFYVGTTAGLLTKISVEDRLGSLVWEFPTGETITSPALVVGNQVVVVTESGIAHAVDDETGFAQWSTGMLNLHRPIAKTTGKVICTTSSGQLIGLDESTGKVLCRTAAMNLSKPIVNKVNDRLYVLTTAGRLQCLRPQGALLPTMIVPLTVSEEEPGQESRSSAQPESQTGDENPFDFGGGSPPATVNPFGGNAGGFDGAAEPADAGGMADPFGSSNNPFGTPATDNPFGGSDNPFGTP